MHNEEVPLCLCTTFLEKLCPCLQNSLAVGGAIITPELAIAFDRFDPAARSASSVSLAEERVPVLDSAEEVADVDKVEEVVLPGPVEGGIVDLEADVGRNPLGLSWGEVRADYFGVGVLVGKVTEGLIWESSSGGIENHTLPRYLQWLAIVESGIRRHLTSSCTNIYDSLEDIVRSNERCSDPGTPTWTSFLIGARKS